MTKPRRRLAAAVLFAMTAGLAMSVPEVASAHPSKSAITAAAAGAGSAHRVPRLKRLRRHGDQRS